MPFGPFRTHSVPINVGALAKFFAAGDVVDASSLAEHGLVKNNDNRAWPVKLLATGEITHALTVRVDQASPAAVAKIEAAGGRVELVGAE
jgi:large subunit ribosomal protein L15